MLWFVGEGEGKGGGQVGSPLARWKGIRSSSATVIVTVERSLLTGTLRGPGLSSVHSPHAATRVYHCALPREAPVSGEIGRRGGGVVVTIYQYATPPLR